MIFSRLLSGFTCAHNPRGSYSRVSRAVTATFLTMATVAAGAVPVYRSMSFSNDASALPITASTSGTGMATSGEDTNGGSNNWESFSDEDSSGEDTNTKAAAFVKGRNSVVLPYTHRTYEVRSATGKMRRVIAAIPIEAPRNKPLSVVLAFHAHSQRAEDFAPNSGLENATASSQAIVVYPQGVGESWEGPTYAKTQHGEDVAFARQAVERVSEDHAVDRKRIYATGFSNGGAMALNMACQAPDVVAGVVGVSGAYYQQQYSGCAEGRVPTMLIHQAGDKHMKLGGGALNGMNYYALESLFEQIGQRNGCQAVPIRGGEPVQGVRAQQFDGCGAETKAVILDGGRHRWESDAISVPAFVWAFLSRQHK